MPFGRFDRSKESILLVVVYHDAHPRLLARLVLRSIVRSFRFTIMNQLGNPRHRRLKVVRHQPNGMDRIQRSTFCCCLLGIPDFGFSRGPQCEPSQGQADQQDRLPYPPVALARCRCCRTIGARHASSSVARWLSRKNRSSSGASIILLVAVRTCSVLGI
jgi:hypothetical protein